MNLNHLHLPVKDALAATEFLVRYFGLERLPGGNRNFVALQDQGGMVLILSKLSKHEAAQFPPGFHVGFIQPTEAAVDHIHARMSADGIEVDPPARLHAWTFYVEVGGVVREQCHADTGTDLDDVVASDDEGFGRPPEELAGQHRGVFGTADETCDPELVTADARDDVRGAGGRPEPLRVARDQLVAPMVPFAHPDRQDPDPDHELERKKGG